MVDMECDSLSGVNKFGRGKQEKGRGKQEKEHNWGASTGKDFIGAGMIFFLLESNFQYVSLWKNQKNYN